MWQWRNWTFELLTHFSIVWYRRADYISSETIFAWRTIFKANSFFVCLYVSKNLGTKKSFLCNTDEEDRKWKHNFLLSSQNRVYEKSRNRFEKEKSCKFNFFPLIHMKYTKESLGFPQKWIKHINTYVTRLSLLSISTEKNESQPDNNLWTAIYVFHLFVFKWILN